MNKRLNLLDVGDARMISYVYAPDGWKNYIRPDLTRDRRNALLDMFISVHPEMNPSDLFVDEFSQNVLYVYIVLFKDGNEWRFWDMRIVKDGDKEYVAPSHLSNEIFAQLPVVDGIWTGKVE